jgi:dihydrofolate reductase
MGHPLIVGRKTFESIGRALPGRQMVVVSRGTPELPAGVALAPSLEAAVARCADEGASEVFIAGGGEIYRRALALADRLIITHVGTAPGASAEARPGDTLFPQWDPADWVRTSGASRSADDANPRPLEFCVYDRRDS